MEDCKFKKIGCLGHMDTNLLNSHYLNKCKFRSCTNTYNNTVCNKIILSENIEKHKKKCCPYRIVQCNGSNKCLIPFCEIDSHNCTKYVCIKAKELLKNSSDLKKSSVLYSCYKGHKDDMRAEIYTNSRISREVLTMLETIIELNKL